MTPIEQVILDACKARGTTAPNGATYDGLRRKLLSQAKAAGKTVDQARALELLVEHNGLYHPVREILFA